MSEIEIVTKGYRELFSRKEDNIVALPQSGSDRKYYRIYDNEQTVIGAYNANREENEAFIGFTKHFLSKGLHVPEVFGSYPDRFVYFLKDLGDENLYTWLQNKPDKMVTDVKTRELYKKILDELILFQMKGIDGLDLDLCYPHRSFDRQSMMWDMNYFKYMLLKLLAVPFSEKYLEHDFNALCDYLLSAGQDYFLYRDFQTANIMVVDDQPWFIDYQGGRKGAPQYDVASLLYDAKIPMIENTRQELLDYYALRYCAETSQPREQFMGFFSGFSMIRVLQALGAFGFRGLYEKKPTFTDSIVPGVKILIEIISSAENHIRLPELYRAVRSIPQSAMFNKLAGEI